MVFIENVAEAAQWELFEVWLAGMTALGYQMQFVSVSAAHVGGMGNDPAPQWRDRLYMVATRNGMRQPDLEPRPIAWCPKCDADVEALQWWKRPGRRIGKYRQQYIYVCPVGDHGQVEPYVMPAINAIDLTDLGTRIGDRAKPLKPSTMRRIQLGLETIAAPSMVFTTNHGKDAGHRGFDPEARPLSSRTTKNGEGFVMTEPFLTMLRRNGRSSRLSEPAATFTGGGFHHALTVPGAFVSAHHNGYAAGDRSLNKPVTEPMRAQTTKITNSLVIPYRRGATPYPVEDGPLSTVATRDQHGVLSVELPKIEDCYFRMLSPRESANSQRFDRSYVIFGNQGEQQLQAGNAVPVNVAQWLGTQTAAVM